MTSELTVLVPTRGRPHNAARLLQAWSQTTRADAGLVFGVDDDDPSISDYRRVIPDAQIFVGPRMGLCATTNVMALAAAQAGFPYLGSIGDDHLPRTVGWDAMVIEALRAVPLSIVYGDDLMQGEGLATAAFMDSAIVLALGYMAPPTMHHLYIDNSWMELGRALGTLRYLPGVVIEHLHPAAGKAEDDETYRAGTSDAIWDHDEAAFNEWKDGGGLVDAVTQVRSWG